MRVGGGCALTAPRPHPRDAARGTQRAVQRHGARQRRQPRGRPRRHVEQQGKDGGRCEPVRAGLGHGTRRRLGYRQRRRPNHLGGGAGGMDRRRLGRGCGMDVRRPTRQARRADSDDRRWRRGSAQSRGAPGRYDCGALRAGAPADRRDRRARPLGYRVRGDAGSECVARRPQRAGLSEQDLRSRGDVIWYCVPAWIHPCIYRCVLASRGATARRDDTGLRGAGARGRIRSRDRTGRG